MVFVVSLSFFFECLATGGSGRIVDKYSGRSASRWKFNYFRLETGHEVSAPPGIFAIGRPQQILEKPYFSASYKFDGVAYSGWPEYIRNLFALPIGFAFVYATLMVWHNPDSE